MKLKCGVHFATFSNYLLDLIRENETLRDSKTLVYSKFRTTMIKKCKNPLAG